MIPTDCETAAQSECGGEMGDDDADSRFIAKLIRSSDERKLIANKYRKKLENLFNTDSILASY